MQQHDGSTNKKIFEKKFKENLEKNPKGRAFVGILDKPEPSAKCMKIDHQD